MIRSRLVVVVPLESHFGLAPDAPRIRQPQARSNTQICCEAGEPSSPRIGFSSAISVHLYDVRSSVVPDRISYET